VIQDNEIGPDEPVQLKPRLDRAEETLAVQIAKVVEHLGVVGGQRHALERRKPDRRL
jgi:hypothetical protein